MCAADANLQKAVVTVPLAIVVFASAHAACVLQKSEAKVRVSLRFFCDLGVTAEQHSCVCVCQKQGTCGHSSVCGAYVRATVRTCVVQNSEARNPWSQFRLRCLVGVIAHMCLLQRGAEAMVAVLVEVPACVVTFAHTFVAEPAWSEFCMR